MKAIKMFCGELDGELVPSHLAFRANRVRHSIAELFFGITWGDTPGWYSSAQSRLARRACAGRTLEKSRGSEKLQ